MPKLKLSYFAFSGGRAEAARLALVLGKIAFEDHRIPVTEWSASKSQMPFQAIPVLNVDGEALTQSNTITRYVGKLAGLYPEDALEAARCDEVLDAIEDLFGHQVATFGISDADEMKAARETLVSGPITRTLTGLNRILEARGGRHFADGRLTVADLKAYCWIVSVRAGQLDHVPTDLAERLAPSLAELCDRVGSNPEIVAYYKSL